MRLRETVYQELRSMLRIKDLMIWVEYLYGLQRPAEYLYFFGETIQFVQSITYE